MSFQIKYVYDLVDRISPSLNKIRRNLRKVGTQVSKTANRSTAAFARMRAGAGRLSRKGIIPLRGEMKKLIAAFTIIAGIRQTIGIFASFGVEMAKVKAFTKATDEQMVRLKETAKKLGISTEFTAGQAAAGMALLGKAGFSVNEVIQAIPETLDLATAGGLDLATATGITAKVLRGFGIEAANTKRITNALAIAASSSNTTIGEMGEAMKFVAAIASISNVSIEEVAATLAVLADNSLAGTLGGTGLRRIMSELLNPTKEAVKVFKKLNLTQADLDFKVRGLMATMKDLAPLTEDVGSAFKVFGDRGTPAFVVVAKNLDNLQELTKQMLATQEAGTDLAKIMRDQLAGDFKALLSATAGNVLTIGEDGLTKSLRTATQASTTFFRALEGSDEALGKLNPSTKVLISLLQKLGTVVAFVFKVIGIGFKFLQLILDVIVITIAALIEGVEIIINFLGKMIGKGFTKAFDFGKSLFGDVTGNQEIVSNNIINQAQATRQEPNNFNVNGQLGININGLPKGSSADLITSSDNQLPIGLNSVFAGQ